MTEKIKILKKAQSEITKERAQELKRLADIIVEMRNIEDVVKVNFICTHNSRRSQLAELMLQQLLLQKGISDLKCYSGGTEATAFNFRMVKAVENFGIGLSKYGPEENPLYIAKGDQYLFSKKYDHHFNPKNKFIAVTTCSDADENCPLILGAEKRFHLGYKDPKHADDQANESQIYSAKVLEIGSEMLKLVELIS